MESHIYIYILRLFDKIGHHDGSPNRPGQAHGHTTAVAISFPLHVHGHDHVMAKAMATARSMAWATDKTCKPTQHGGQNDINLIIPAERPNCFVMNLS